MQKHRYNKSTYFLLPLLEVPFYEFNQGQDCFVNTYIRVESVPLITKSSITIPKEQRYSLYVLLDRKHLDIDALSFAFDESISIFRAISKKNILLGYKFISTLYSPEYSLFKRGRYSQFREEAKELITNYVKNKIVNEHTGKLEDNENYYALYPTQESRTALGIVLGISISQIKEVISIPKLEDETLLIDYGKFKHF